jgi:hypothetical protein
MAVSISDQKCVSMSDFKVSFEPNWGRNEIQKFISYTKTLILKQIPTF